MAKTLIYNYIFDASAKTIKITGNFPERTLLLITNTTDGQIIYNFADPNAGASVSYDTTNNETTITLDVDTTSMSDTDEIQILVDDYLGSEVRPNRTTQDPVEKVRVSNPQALIDTDFEYSLQATKWESVQLQNNIPGIFQKANEPAFQGTDITSILPASNVGGAGVPVASSITFSEEGRSGMSVTYSGNRDDGNYSINLPFNFTFADGNTYNRAYFGTNGYITFGGGSSQYWSQSSVDQPNLAAIKVFAADRRLYWLGYKTTGYAPNRTFICRWEGTNYYPQLSSGGIGSHIYEIHFKEGQPNFDLHYVRAQQIGTAALQDGPGPETSFLLTWSPSNNSSAPYTTGQGFNIAWGGGGTNLQGLEIIVGSAPSSPFQIGDPVILKETKDTLYLDGAFLIVGVPNSTTFQVLTRSPNTYSGDQKTDYTAIYTGGFFSNASMALSSVTAVSGTTRARITFSSNHGLYVGSKLYIVDSNQVGATHIGAFVVSRVYSDTQVEYITDEVSNYSNNNTLSTATTQVYARNEGISQHRYYDGGVQINPSSNSPNAQIIRQTRKYFRYQSGKGIQFSTGVLFRPAYDVSVMSVLTNVYNSGTYENWELDITTDQEHGFTSSGDYLEGAQVKISGITVADGNGTNTYNGTYRINNVGDGTRFNVIVPIGTNTGMGTDLGGTPKVEVTDWNDAVVRSGLFDDQNGLFLEHDGAFLYAVRRTSTEQVAGKITVNQNSSAVTGTNTKFMTQLKEEDYIVIKGQSYIVTKISSDTALTISPEYKALTLYDTKIVKTNDFRVRQDNFNLDTIDGNGPSGYTFEPNKMQMVFMDYSWYGAGRVRWGMRVSSGEIIYMHEERQNNVNTEAYMRTGNIPGRFEIQSKSKNGKIQTALTTSSSSVQVLETDAAALPSQGTIVINNEKMEYTKAGTSGSNRILTLNTRNVGGKSSNSTASINDTFLSQNQNCSPSLSHWGVSCIMDGRFDVDKSYIFTAANQSTRSVSSGSRLPLISIRLAPSVDYGIPGFFGVRNLINRSALSLDSIGLAARGIFTYEVVINSESDVFSVNNNWRRAPNGSIAQYIDHSLTTGGSFNSGDVVFAGFSDEGSGRFSTTQVNIAALRELGNSILGGPGVYPDGPDVLTLYVTNNSGSTRTIFGRISWQESQG